MSKITEIGSVVIGVIALCCVNALAFVFDSEWIKVAIALDSAFVGALTTYYFKGVSRISNSNGK